MLVGFFRGSRGVGILGADLGLRLSVAAVARRNGIAVWAGFRVAKKRADARIQLRTDDVFEAAGLRVRFGFVNGKSVFEQSLRQTMASHDIACALASYGSQLHLSVLQRDQMQTRHARKTARGRLFGHG